MNLIQIQSDLQMLPDQALQQQLLRPGMAPSYLVMGELQRRKEMRKGSGAQMPQGNMAEEFARGLGQADVGNYSQALGEAIQASGQPPSPQPKPIPPSLGQPPGGMNLMQAPQGPLPGPPQGFADGGEVEDPQAARWGDPQSPMAKYRRLMEMMRRNQMSLPPGGMPQAQPSPQYQGPPIIAPPALPPANAPEGPPVPADTRSMLQRFQGAMANQSPDASVLAAEALKNMPPMNFDGGMPQARAYEQALEAARQNYQPLSNRPPGTSVGQELSNRLMGRPSVLPRSQGAGVQDYPPDVPQSEAPPKPREKPRMELGGESPAWLKEDPLTAALKTSLEGADGLQPPPDRPFTGTPNRGPGMPRTEEPPAGGGLPRPQGQPPSGGAPRGAAGPGGGALVQEPLDRLVDTFEGARAPDRYAELIAQNRARKDALQSGIEGDRGMALLTAGLGIMGGQSPNAMTNIGRGALLGVENWKDASREMRMAEKDIYNADQALAVAQANRDERAVEMAFKAKTVAEESRQRAADRAEARASRGAASGEAAANRSLTLDLKRQELEQNKLDREERRQLSEIQGVITEGRTAQQRLHDLYRDYRDASDPLKNGNPSEAKKVFEPQLKEQQRIIEESQKSLEGFRIEREARAQGMAMPKTQKEYDGLPPGTPYYDSRTRSIKRKPVE